MIAGIGKANGRGARRPFRGGVIGAIDVGASKVACLIVKPVAARPGVASQMRVLGLGLQASTGVRNGNLTDVIATEDAIRAAVEQAEQQAGLTLKEAVIGISCGQPQSRTINVEVSIAGREVSEDILRSAYATGRAQIVPSDREAIHCMPGSFTIDGHRGIRNPRGMIGDTLGVGMHVVTAASGPIRNLTACVSRCHLNVTGKVVTAYASGLSTLVADEMDMGATVIDMGGGTTSVAVFMDGGLVHVDCLPLGGNHVTSDIARGLSTSLSHAERLKTLEGNALSGPGDVRDMVDVPQLGEDDSDGDSLVPRSVLTGIIQARIEETFEMLRDRLDACGLAPVSTRRVVLTGGASQLSGVRDIAARILSKQVRLGRPSRLTNLPASIGGASLAASAGLATWAAQGPEEVEHFDEEPAFLQPAYGTYGATQGFAGIRRWFKENF